MLGRLGVLVVVLLALGCSSRNTGAPDGGGAGARDGGTDGPGLDCQTLSARWRDLVASLSATCTADADCLLAGVRENFADGPYSGIGWTGVAVNAAAYAQSAAEALEDEWLQVRCGRISDPICINAATCADGQCQVVTMRSCGEWCSGTRCPTVQYCYYDERTATGCFGGAYSATCVSDCAPESVCGWQACCGPGTYCADCGWCVAIPDGGVPADAATDAAPAEGTADAAADQ
jgi:hypothetical protein